MVGTKNNRRTLYTQKVIKEAFIDLLATEDFAKINVTQITKKAQINRGTFYQYYQDPQDLFQKIQAELTAEILPLIKVHGTDDLADWLERFIKVLDDNRVLSLTLLRSNQNNYLLEAVFAQVKELALTEFQRMYQEDNPQLLEYIFTYFVKGTIGTIVEWMSKDDGTTPAEISLVLAKVLPRK